MIEVINASVSNDARSIYLNMMTDPQYLFTEILMWNETNFKNPDTAVNLNYKIGLTNELAFEISSELDNNNRNFEGLTFIQVKDNSPEQDPNCTLCSNTQLIILTNFNSFYRCAANLLNKMDSCINSLFSNDSNCCNRSEVSIAMNIIMLIDSIRINLNIGNYVMAIEHYNNLKKICKTCSEFTIQQTSGCTSCN